MEMLYWWVRQRGCEHGKTRAAIQRDANTIPGRNTRMFSIYFLWYRSRKQASSTANQKLGFSEGAGPKSSHAVPARRDWLLSPPLLQAFVPSRAVVCVIESRCGEATRFQLSNKGWKLHLQMKSWHLAWSSSLPSLCYNYLGHEEGENSAKLTDLPPPPSPRTKTSEDIFKKVTHSSARAWNAGLLHLLFSSHCLPKWVVSQVVTPGIPHRRPLL